MVTVLLVHYLSLRFSPALTMVLHMMWRPYPLPPGCCLLNLCNSPFSVALEPNIIWQYSSLIHDYLILFFYYFVISGTLITAATGLSTDLEGMVVVTVEA